MPGRVEQMGVGVERHARAGVAEDAADLDDVEADVDDQVAGEGMPQIVEAHPPAGTIEPRAGGGAAKHTLGHVVVQKRRAICRGEHVVGSAREAGAAFVLTENRGELGEERDLPDRGARLWWDPVRRQAATATRELMTNVNDAGREIDVVPAQPEHLGEAHTRIRPREKQRLIPPRAGGEETGELCLGEDALVGAERMRSLVTLEPVEGVSADVAAAKREREDAAERAEDSLDRPGRETVCLQRARDCDDVVCRDQRQAPSAEPGQKMAAQLRAVEIERPVTPLTRCDLRSELSEPATRDLGECEPRRERQVAAQSGSLQQLALPPCLDECCCFERAEARPSVGPHADGVLAVRLLIDPPLDAHTPASSAAGHPGSSIRRYPEEHGREADAPALFERRRRPHQPRVDTPEPIIEIRHRIEPTLHLRERPRLRGDTRLGRLADRVIGPSFVHLRRSVHPTWQSLLPARARHHDEPLPVRGAVGMATSEEADG